MKHPDKPFGMIEWEDAVGDMVGKAHEIQHRPERCQTYGWILRSDEHGVSIAGDWVMTDDEFRSITFIPRLMVREEKLLKLASLPKPRAKLKQEEAKP